MLDQILVGSATSLLNLVIHALMLAAVAKTVAARPRQRRRRGIGPRSAQPLSFSGTVRRRIAKISAVDQPIRRMPFSAVIGPSRRRCGTVKTSP